MDDTRILFRNTIEAYNHFKFILRPILVKLFIENDTHV